MSEIKDLICRALGHKWFVIHINKKEWKTLGAWCSRCDYGHKETMDFLDKNGYNEPGTDNEIVTSGKFFDRMV